MEVEKIQDWFRTSFKNEYDMVLQQSKSLLESHVSRGSYKGENAVIVKRLGTVEFKEATGRFTDTEFTDIEHSQRWLSYRLNRVALPITKVDILNMVEDSAETLKSQYATGIAHAHKRKMDELIISAALGKSYAGNDYKDEIIALPAEQKISASLGGGAATGLTRKKLLEARERLMLAEVDLDMEKPKLVISPRQMTQIKEINEFIARDYNPTASSQLSYIGDIEGFEVLVSQKKLNLAGANRECFAFVKSGLHWGDWENLKIVVSQRADKNNDWQILAEFAGDATRTDEPKVVQIDCKED